VQSCLLAASASAVSQHLAVTDDQDIRDKLLEAFIQLGLAPVAVHKVRSGGYDRQIPVNFRAQALKHAQLFEESTFKTKHSFFCCHLPICHSISRLATLNIAPSAYKRNTLITSGGTRWRGGTTRSTGRRVVERLGLGLLLATG
jgi:hypothetical protein